MSRFAHVVIRGSVDHSEIVGAEVGNIRERSAADHGASSVSGHKVVIVSRVGRLANRLLLFGHFIGAAVGRGFTVFDPAFLSMARYFPATAKATVCRYPPAASSLAVPGAAPIAFCASVGWSEVLHGIQRLGGDVGLIRLRRDQTLDLNSPAFLDVVARHNVVFVRDWFFRNGTNCARHRDVICSFFTPFEKHLEGVRSVVEPVREQGRLLVGVHIRRGDYQSFKSGRFFYSHAQYREIMLSAEEIFGEREVAFLVCSDEPVPRDAFAGLDVVSGPGSAIEDLYALAACDRIIGAPSTFTTWASYYGAVPRYTIHDPSASFDCSSFVVDRGLGRSAEPDQVT